MPAALAAALPVAAKPIGLRCDSHGANSHRVLRSVRLAAAILAPCHFSSVGAEIVASDAMMNTDLGAADAREE